MNQLSKLQAAGTGRYIPAAYFAVLWRGLGDKNQAFTWLHRAYRERSEQVLYIEIEPLVDPLRSEPRFGKLLQKVGLKS